MANSFTDRYLDATEEQIDALLTIKQTIKYYGNVDHSTIWRWVKKGALPAPIKIGGRSLWRLSDIQKHIRDARS